jgi:hypothetical protein
MFKGKAELIDPETKKVAAIFNETEHHDGTTMATVRLEKPVVLQGTQRLEVFGTVTDQPMISVGASDPAGTEIREFHGNSAIGPSLTTLVSRWCRGPVAALGPFLS